MRTVVTGIENHNNRGKGDATLTARASLTAGVRMAARAGGTVAHGSKGRCLVQSREARSGSELARTKAQACHSHASQRAQSRAWGTRVYPLLYCVRPGVALSAITRSKDALLRLLAMHPQGSAVLRPPAAAPSLFALESPE